MNKSIDELRLPFPAQDIEWRVQNFGIGNSGPWVMVLAYVTNRAIQSRLDRVCGPLGWQNEYKAAPLGGIMCGISVFDAPNSHWITKWDGAENTKIEEVKGGLSSSMKRAGSQWGIGRYLYKLEANFADISSNRPSKQDKKLFSQHYDKKTSTNYYWRIPTLPEWALPKENS